MSARTRPPTDELRTAVYDPASGDRAARPAIEVDEATDRTGPPDALRAHSPTKPGYARGGGTSRPPRTAATPPGSFPAADDNAPTPIAVRRPERSEPIKVISLKTPAELKQARAEKKSRRMPKPHIRSIGEVSGTHTPPGGMGFLAPPRNPEEARTRHTRSNLRWAAMALIVAVAVGVGIWALAR